MEIKKVRLLKKDGESGILSIGSGCVIIKNNKVLLVRGKGGTQFKFPGGHIDDTENFKESAVREAMEEIGCVVEPVGDPIFYLLEVDSSLSIILIHYAGKIISGTPAPNTEIEEIIWCDINNIPENTFDNVKKVLTELKNRVMLA